MFGRRHAQAIGAKIPLRGLAAIALSRTPASAYPSRRRSKRGICVALRTSRLRGNRVTLHKSAFIRRPLVLAGTHSVHDDTGDRRLSRTSPDSLMRANLLNCLQIAARISKDGCCNSFRTNPVQPAMSFNDLDGRQKNP